MIALDHITQSQNLVVATLAPEDVHLLSKLAMTERVHFMKCFEEKPEAIFLVVQEQSGQFKVQLMLANSKVESESSDQSLSTTRDLIYVAIQGQEYVIVACSNKLMIYLISSTLLIKQLECVLDPG